MAKEIGQVRGAILLIDAYGIQTPAGQSCYSCGVSKPKKMETNLLSAPMFASENLWLQMIASINVLLGSATNLNLTLV